MVNKFLTSALLLTLIFVFHPWFNFDKTLSSGDWPYLFTENIKEFTIPPTPPFIWVDPYYQFTAKLGVEFLKIPWNITEKIFWFYPFLIISGLSSWLLGKSALRKIIGTNPFLELLCPLIYLTNTYVLMVVGGGQMGVVMSYAFAPLVLYMLFTLEKRNTLSVILVNALALMFDLRIYLLTIGIFMVLSLFQWKLFEKKKQLAKLVFIFVITCMFNLLWFIPNIPYYAGQYKGLGAVPNVSFLSFASFSNGIALLHPNWPENIFGKVYFLRSEFLLLPIIAFSGLLFDKYRKSIIPWVAIALIGIFFSKGINPPFGSLYAFFSSIPGSILFRDPTKFYLLIVMSYMILVPVSLHALSVFSSKKISGNLGKVIFPLLFLILWGILIFPALTGKLGGTFRPRSIPQEYISLKNIIQSEHADTASLWIPQRQRFGFYSNQHQAFNSQEIFGNETPDSLTEKITSQEGKQALAELDIKLIIVPYDIDGEFFLDDRKYSQLKRDQFEKSLDDISFLKKNTIGSGRSEIDIYSFAQ